MILIIRIEGDNFDDEWREHLCRVGMGHNDGASDMDDEEGPEDALGQAQRRLETPGQRFRKQVMQDLFNSVSCVVERRP